MLWLGILGMALGGTPDRVEAAQQQLGLSEADVARAREVAQGTAGPTLFCLEGSGDQLNACSASVPAADASLCRAVATRLVLVAHTRKLAAGRQSAFGFRVACAETLIAGTVTSAGPGQQGALTVVERSLDGALLQERIMELPWAPASAPPSVTASVAQVAGALEHHDAVVAALGQAQGAMQALFNAFATPDEAPALRAALVAERMGALDALRKLPPAADEGLRAAALARGQVLLDLAQGPLAEVVGLLQSEPFTAQTKGQVDALMATTLEREAASRMAWRVAREQWADDHRLATAP